MMSPVVADLRTKYWSGLPLRRYAICLLLVEAMDVALDVRESDGVLLFSVLCDSAACRGHGIGACIASACCHVAERSYQ